MVKDLKRLIWSCEEYERYRDSEPAETLIQAMDASHPFQKLSMNLAQQNEKNTISWSLTAITVGQRSLSLKI